MNLEWNEILTFAQTPQSSSDTPKTTISDTAVFEKSVFGLYSLFFGVSAKVNIQFYSNFNKEQNPHSLEEIIYIQIVIFWIYCQ